MLRVSNDIRLAVRVARIMQRKESTKLVLQSFHFALTLRAPSGGHCVELNGIYNRVKLAMRWEPSGPRACQAFIT